MKTCICCKKKLPKHNKQLDGSNIATRSLFIARIDPDMLFCTLRCAALYGVRAAKEDRKAGDKK